MMFSFCGSNLISFLPHYTYLENFFTTLSLSMMFSFYGSNSLVIPKWWYIICGYATMCSSLQGFTQVSMILETIEA